jgi:hypothetical protein
MRSHHRSLALAYELEWHGTSRNAVLVANAVMCRKQHHHHEIAGDPGVVTVYEMIGNFHPDASY